MNLIQTLNIDQNQLSSSMEEIAFDYLFTEIEDDTNNYHRDILSLYDRECVKNEGVPFEVRLELLNIVLRSALKCGDFLNLSSLIYKTNKELERIDQRQFGLLLANYYEVCSLYHFYENEIQTALDEIEFVLDHKSIANETIERCFYYYLGMLLGGYLPIKADAILRKFKLKYPVLNYNPMFYLMEAIIYAENHKTLIEVEISIDKMKEVIREEHGYDHLLRASQHLLKFINDKSVRVPNIRLFPETWEQVFRLDLWAKAKQNNKFYYDLILDHWQSRKQIF